MNIEISNEANLPTIYGDFKIRVFKEILDSKTLEHFVIKTEKLDSNPLLRIHSECLTGDVFGSLKCDCGNELAYTMKEIAKHNGMLIYLRQEGRGIGLFNKINAYNLQDKGMDTVEANEALGFKKDERSYEIVGKILDFYNIKKLRLLTNNPKKIEELNRFATIERESIIMESNVYNCSYLKVKKEKLGHLF